MRKHRSWIRFAHMQQQQVTEQFVKRAGVDAMPALQAFVVVGDSNGHVGLGVKCAKEVTP